MTEGTVLEKPSEYFYLQRPNDKECVFPCYPVAAGRGSNYGTKIVIPQKKFYLTSPMKPVKQNILSMIAVALFAILAAVVEGSFVYDYGTEMGRASEYGKVSADNVHAESPLFLLRESTAEAMQFTRRSGQQVSLRASRGNGLQGDGGRSSATFKQATPFPTKIARPTVCAQCGFPLPLVYQKSKEYYVYTLERMLC